MLGEHRAVILSAVVTAVVGVLVMEFYQTTSWLADKLMKWSVRVRYADNPHRAKVRGEELIGLLEDLPTLFKFPTAGWFFLHALAHRFGRGRSLGGIPTDQVLKLRMRCHWAVLPIRLLLTIGIMIGAFSLSQLISSVGADLWLVQSLLWSIAAVAMLRLTWHVLEWWVEVIVVTDKQLMLTYGVIRRKIHMTPFTELTDVRLGLQPVAGRAARLRHHPDEVAHGKSGAGAARGLCPVGFQKSACAVDLGDWCAWPSGA